MDRRYGILNAESLSFRSLVSAFIMIVTILSVPSRARCASNQIVLTEDDLNRIIRESASRSAEPLSLVAQIMSKLDDHAMVTGDILRRALTDSHIVLPEPLSVLINAVQSVTRTGSTIALAADRGLQTTINGSAVRLKPSVTLILSVEAGNLTISNISGVEVKKLLWFDVQQVRLRLNREQRSLLIVTSGGSREFSLA